MLQFLAQTTLAVLCVFGGALAAQEKGVDLASLPRTLQKEPKYESGAPKYALMVLGAKAETRIWLVIDGKTLYADLNGDGDLTEEGEKFAEYDYGGHPPNDGSVTFQINELRVGERVHRDFYVAVNPAAPNANSAIDYKQLVEKDPQALAYRVGGQLEIPDLPGTGVGGRKQVVALIDDQGVLQFASDPASAPVIHFGGKRQLALMGYHELSIGRSKELALGVATRGVGPGASAWYEYNDVPVGTTVFADSAFPSAGGGEPIREKTSSTDRCCNFNFLMQLRTPENAAPGVAQLKLLLANVFPHDIAAGDVAVKVVAPKNKLVLRPVTKRLVREYFFPQREAIASQLRFSPSGDRLLSADYPGGMVMVWNVKTGDALLQVETGKGYRGSANYVMLAPDWKSFYVFHNPVRKIEQIDLNGETGVRASFAGAIRGWSLETGEPIALLKHSPPRGEVHALMSPDGKWIAAVEEMPGDYKREDWGGKSRAVSLWNVAEKTARPLGEEGEFPLYFSPDSRGIAFLKSGESSGLIWRDAASGEAKWLFAMAEKGDLYPVGVSADGKRLIVSANQRDPMTHAYKSARLKSIDIETGELLAEQPLAAEEGAVVQQAALLGDEQWLDVQVVQFKDQLHQYREWRLLSEKQGTIREHYRLTPPQVDGYMTHRGLLAISPNGKYAAMALNWVPNSRAELLANPSPFDLPQPQLWLVEVDGGKVIEKIDLPQGIANTIAFSPDGKSIAVPSAGKVGLVDISDLVASP